MAHEPIHEDSEEEGLFVRDIWMTLERVDAFAGVWTLFSHAFMFGARITKAGDRFSSILDVSSFMRTSIEIQVYHFATYHWREFK